MSNKLTYNGKEYWWKDGEESVDKLMSASGFIGDSLSAAQLSVDTLTAVVRSYDVQTRLLAADGMLLAADGKLLSGNREISGLDVNYKYGENVHYYHGDDLIGRFRLESITRIGAYAYQLQCISDVGLLLTSSHYGGMYTGQSMAEIVADIIGDIIPYTLDATLGATPVYGWLPKGVRRDNLRDVLFAVGGQIRKDTAGQVNIVPMEAGTPYEIVPEEMYMGGSVTGGNPATGVNVTEHSFIALPTDEVTTLFDGEAAAEPITTPSGRTVEGVLVEFGEPIHDLVVENSEILERGANYAVLSRSPSALLTGKRYTHTKRIITRNSGIGSAPNIVSSNSCTLVNLLNAELVADRLMAYYGSAKTVEADIVVSNQKPGDAIIFTDPFGNLTTGYIGSLSLTMSAIIKGHAELISGYIPTSSGNYYSNVEIIGDDRTWTVPPECKGKIRIVLIGGGEGGHAGENGGYGTNGKHSTFGNSGSGGLPGAPGRGGKIFIATISTKTGNQFSIKIGDGGDGGYHTTNEDGSDFVVEPSSGEETSFGEYSTKEGYRSDSGVKEVVGGNVYAFPGNNGIAGGAGRSKEIDPETVTYNGIVYYPGENGNDSEDYENHKGYGGLGGGAAAGANGKDGTAGSGNWQPYAEAGDGGDGADATDATDAEIPGQGGQGGHGGGGAGGGGTASGNSESTWPYGQAGSPGKGGKGGKGARGVVLIYY